MICKISYDQRLLLLLSLQYFLLKVMVSFYLLQNIFTLLFSHCIMVPVYLKNEKYMYKINEKYQYLRWSIAPPS